LEARLSCRKRWKVRRLVKLREERNLNLFHIDVDGVTSNAGTKPLERRARTFSCPAPRFFHAIDPAKSMAELRGA